MLIATWLAMFVIGWFSDRWRSGLLIAPVVAAGTTALCLVTTNSPVFTAVDSRVAGKSAPAEKETTRGQTWSRLRFSRIRNRSKARSRSAGSADSAGITNANRALRSGFTVRSSCVDSTVAQSGT